MLLQFSAKNYKSFKEEFIFNLKPVLRHTGLDYSILNEKIDKKNYKALCSSVIYGPNAAGKTNIIGAMETFKQIVLRGNILNADPLTPNEAAFSLELIPFYKDKKNGEVEFSIEFIEKGLLVNYNLSIDLGAFLEEKYKRKVIKEELKINTKNIFERTEQNLTINCDKYFEKYFNSKDIKGIQINEIARNSQNITDLFLTNGFRTIVSNKLADIILGWIQNKFIIVYNSNEVISVKKLKDEKKNYIYEERVLSEIADLFGKGSEMMGFVKDKENQHPILCSMVKNEKKIAAAIPAEIFESYGTYRFLNEIPIILRALAIGGILVIDEFDASLHPMALMSIINIFHNDEINVNKAQLVFNTHNPIFLSSKLFRRDEIKFVERKDNNSTSVLYALSDFKTNGKEGVRKGEDYMKNYFISRYGAIKEIDFSDIFKRLIKKETDEDNE